MPSSRSLAALAKAEERDRAKYEASRAARIKAEREATEEKRLKWGTILDHLGLLALEEARLKEVLNVAYRLVTEERVSWSDTAPSKSPAEIQAEVEWLMANDVTLVVVDEAGQPLSGELESQSGGAASVGSTYSHVGSANV